MRFLLNHKIYVILVIVLLLATALELTRSEFILRVSNEGLTEDGLQPLNLINAIDLEQAAALDRLHWYLVYDEEDEDSAGLSSNASIVLRQMKQQFTETDVKEFVFPKAGNNAVLISVYNLDGFNRVEDIIAYIQLGGSVFFLNVPDVTDSFYRIYRQLGINEIGNYYRSDSVKIVSTILNQAEGDEYHGEYVADFIRKLTVDQESEVLLTDSMNNPMMWERRIGEGRVVVFNGYMLLDKTARGLLVGGITRLTDDFIYPILNAKLMYIDDFPAPIPNGKHSVIYDEYKRETPSFYRDIWWPDMIKIASKHDLVYTAVIIQSYQDRVEPPFADPQDASRDLLVMYGREVLKNKGELGIHGYNHQALLMDQNVMDIYEYTAWPKQSYMEESIATVLDYFNTSFPWYKPVTYVPPSNALSIEGRNALAAAWPELDNIGSVFDGDPAYSYVQEFEVADDGIVEMPRITSGYQDSGMMRWYASNVINYLGVFSHFVHPDDILNEERSFGGLNWEQLSKDFERYVAWIDDQYGWLRQMTARDASTELRKWAMSEPYIVHSDNRIEGYINQFAGDQYFMLHTTRKIASLDNCEIKKIHDGVYLVHVTDANFRIELGRLL